MDLKESLKQIAERAKQRTLISTEEATKNAFVMPFIRALGYDVFNPLEVVPEFVADIGLKRGEKIDYAILQNGEPILLIECKHWKADLDIHNGQLLRYFHTSKAKFGLLTNGVTYRFYSDLIETNRMDEKPFLEFDITELRDSHLEEIRKFHKAIFDVDNILASASELKYARELKQLLQQEFNSPSPDLVRLFAKKVYPGPVTIKILDIFTGLFKKSYQQHLGDLINERLKTALVRDEEDMLGQKESIVDVKPQHSELNYIHTTEEELEAYCIIKSVLRNEISVDRITIRDVQSYCSILLDDNNRKPLCRLYFNTTKKYISTFDENKKETKIEIQGLNSIFQYAKYFEQSIRCYEMEKTLNN